MLIGGIDDRFRVFVVSRAAESRSGTVRAEDYIIDLSAIRRAYGRIVAAEDLAAKGSRASVRYQRFFLFITLFRDGSERSMHIQRWLFSFILVNG